MKINFLEHSKELIIIYDIQGTILDVSPVVFKLLGYHAKDLINNNFSSLLHPQDNQKIIFSDILLNTSKSSEILMHRFRTIENQYVWFETNFSKLRKDNNEVEGILGNSFKIPEKNLSDQFYSNLENKYEFLGEHSQDVISVHSLSGDTIFISPIVEKITGFKPSELIGKSGFERMHPEDIERIKEGALALNLKGLSSLIEYRSVKKDGSYIWFETLSSVILDKNGMPYQILCTTRDITARKIIEKNLRESQQRYQSLFDYNPDAIFITDLNGFITDINEAGLEMAQKPKEVLTGLHILDLAHPNDKEMFLSLYQETKDGVVKQTTVETINFAGQKIIIDLKIVPIVVDGKMLGRSSIVRDVTEISRIQKEKELLYLTSKHIDKDETLKIAIDNILEQICKFSDSVLGELWFPVSTGNYTKLQNYYSKSDPVLQNFVNASKTIKVEQGKGLQGSTWKTRQTTWHNNILNDPDFIRRRDAAKAGIASCISVQIMFKDECIAVLILFFDSSRNEETNLLNFINTVANHMASEIIKRKSAEELKLFFEISSDLLCIAGFDGYYKKVNDSFNKVLGHNIEDLLENTFYNIIHPDDIENIKAEIQGLEGGEPVQYFENRMICKDGSFKWFEWTAQSLPDHEVFFCIGRDITYQKAKEEELLRIMLAVEGTNDAIAILDKEKKLIYHNKAFLETIGYTPKELNFIGGLPAIYADRRQFHKVQKKITKGLPYEGDIQLINAKKEVIDFNIRANIIFNDQRQDIGLLFIFTNISERLKMEKKIQNEKFFAESTINALPGIFYMIDNHGKLKRWNKNYEYISGFTSKEIALMNPADFFHKEDKKKFELMISEVFKKGKSHVEAAFLQKSGKTIPFYFTGVLTVVNNESFLLGFGLDITERVNAEKELEKVYFALAQRADELIASNEELENFAYIASHDLQEPLRMITGFLQLLASKYKGVIDEEGIQYIEFVLEGADRMKALILDLLEYSKVGTSLEVVSEVDLNEVMDAMHKIYKEKIEENNVQLIYNNLPKIKGIKIQIMQLFQNLIGNAIKYRSHRAPVIKLKVEDEEKQWKISINDNGLGIPEKFFDKIFIIFKRLHSKKEYSGTGLGLAICKKVVERHGGKIWVESTENEGSTFTFVLLK